MFAVKLKFESRCLRCFHKSARLLIKLNVEPGYLDYKESGSKVKRLYAWGHANHGALGEQKLKGWTTRMQRVYIPVRKKFAFDHEVVDIACGFGFSLFAVKTKKSEKLFGCGINTDSQIGYHTLKTRRPLTLLCNMVPINLPFKSNDTKVIKVAAGRAHSVVLTDPDGLFLFGNNAFGQCGRSVCEGEDYSKNHEITKIPDLNRNRIIDMACGQDHSLFITDGGCVYSCGLGADGQTGLGHYRYESRPTLVEGDIKGENIVKLSSSTDTVLALNDKGEVFGWGNSEYHQLLLPETYQQCNVPFYLKKLQPIGKIIDIASGGTFSMALNDKGEVYIWGYGILGKGPELTHSDVPTKIPETLFGRNVFQPESKVVGIGCGLTSMFAVTNYGNLYTWGYNHHGELGLGHFNPQFFPFQVSISASVLKACMGVDHTIALCKPFF